MLEPALVAGFTGVGMDVFLVGPMPTPAVAMLTRALRCDLGVMISASHNPFHDNGIKLFGPDGYKLSDEAEHGIEAMILGETEPRLADRSEEHTSELQSLMRISYAVFCLKKKNEQSTCVLKTLTRISYNT